MPPGTSLRSRRRQSWVVIAARGDRLHQLSIRPWQAVAAACLLLLLLALYPAATAYLVLRDGLLHDASASMAELKQAHERQILRLQAEIGRLQAHQHHDRSRIERRVDELVRRHALLQQRQSSLLPQFPKDRQPDANVRFGDADRALDRVEASQAGRLRALIVLAEEQAGAIAAALTEAGLELDDSPDAPAGGPLLAAYAPPESADFSSEMQELAAALEELQDMQSVARQLPHANPLPGAEVSSRFGMRRDPFLGRRAHHSGIDFRAQTGQEVLATGNGTISAAGWHAGYGRMVEIDHGSGIVSRYAHLDRIRVRPGEAVEAGALIGKSGNTGRSTGPHLHYEVRISGKAVDPLRFLRFGRKIQGLL